MMATSQLTYEPITKQPSVVVFTDRHTIEEELAVADDFHDQLEVQLDFSNVQRIGSIELSVLVRFCLNMHRKNTEVVVINVSQHLHELFQITRFVRLAEVRS
jgi:anti-anti-sigma regulatory factor